jgi:hypothetical protein
MKQRTSPDRLLADRLTRLHRPLPPDLIDRAIAEAATEDAATRPATGGHGIAAASPGGGRVIPTLPSAPPQRRRPNSLRLALSAVTALAVAAGTFAAIVATSGHNGRVGVSEVTGTPPATATPATAPWVTISTVAATGAAPVCTELPLAEPNLVSDSTSTQFGFLDTATGAFTVDSNAPAGSLKPGGPTYLSTMAGWWSPQGNAPNPNNMIAIAPDGASYAYVLPDASGYYGAGSVHVATPTSDRTLTPPGEWDILVGWSDEGIVVQRVAKTGAPPAITGTWVVDSTTGKEREITLPPLGPDSPGNVTTAGNAVWEVIGSGAAPADTLVRYDLQTGVTTRWFDLEGYLASGGRLPAGDRAPDNIDVLGFDNQGEPVIVIGTQGGTEPTAELLLVRGQEAVTVIRTAGQPGADSPYVQPDGDGFWFSGTDSSPQVVYHWDPITGWHAVTSLTSGVDIARVVGPCAG